MMEHAFYKFGRSVLALIAFITVLLTGTLPVMAGNIVAARAWPADDYTRITLEHDGNVHAKHFLLANPDRLVVHVDGTELNATLKELISKIQPDDPDIQQVRVGQLNPKTVRLVFDLKTAVNPQVFSLAPIDKYKHRLVLDLYPKEPLDPIAALIMKGEWKDASGTCPDRRKYTEKIHHRRAFPENRSLRRTSERRGKNATETYGHHCGRSRSWRGRLRCHRGK